VLGIVVSAARSFAETEYIDMVPDKIQDLESSLFKILGTNPKSVQFAEFALRYGKRYDSVRQLVHSFSTFMKNAELIESRICMNLSYTLVIKGNFPIFFFFFFFFCSAK
jgi:cathepsin H